MSSKKYYAVKVGKKTGIFESWDQCKAQIDGYSGAIYKGFKSREEAMDFIEGSEMKAFDTDLVTYVDGSYNDAIKKYSFGCVFILKDGRIFTQFGNGDSEEGLKHRNVTGEMLGAMYAVNCAIKSGYKSLEICYDYEGIEKWATGLWKTNNEYTAKYAESMKKWQKNIAIKFTKVAAHTNIEFNELADQLAKKGLEEGCGVPKIMNIEDLTVYETE